MEKKKAVIKVKLDITMECLERQKCENVETKFKDAYTTAGLPVFCHYQVRNKNEKFSFPPSM